MRFKNPFKNQNLREISEKIVIAMLILPEGTVILILALYGLGYISPQNVSNGFYSVIQGKGFYGLSSYEFNSTNVTLTTINTIKIGRYITSLDKNGLNGTLVGVTNVRVIGVTAELDGDTHIEVVDSTGQQIVTEFTQGYNRTTLAYQILAKLKLTTPKPYLPKINQSINIVGVAYCDTFHAAEQWHSQRSCWEIHPAVAWANNTQGFITPIGNQTAYNFVPEPYPEP